MNIGLNALRTLVSLCLCINFCKAQSDVANLKYKRRLLKGNWQLVQTFTEDSLHPIPKEEYDMQMRIRCFGKYAEEVKYEGYHWIIKGRWETQKHSAKLFLSKREYTLGKLEDVPEDLPFELIALSKTNYAVSGTAKGKPVKMYFERIPRNHKD